MASTDRGQTAVPGPVREYPAGRRRRGSSPASDAEQFLDGIRGIWPTASTSTPRVGRPSSRLRQNGASPSPPPAPPPSRDLPAAARISDAGSPADRRHPPQRGAGWVKDRSNVLAPGSSSSSTGGCRPSSRRPSAIASSPHPHVSASLSPSAVTPSVPWDSRTSRPSCPRSPTASAQLIVFAAGMGLRQGECFGLTVDRVDFLRRQVGSTASCRRSCWRAGVRPAEDQGRVSHSADA